MEPIEKITIHKIEKGKAITILDNEPYLRQVSKPVSISDDPALKEEIAILKEYCKTHTILAMAAVQLGIPKRLIYLKNTNIDIVNNAQFQTKEEEIHTNCDESSVLINPVILEREGLTEYWEACASCLDHFGRVKRPYKMKVEYYDIQSQKHIKDFIGFECTVLSHEMDHLDGILHMDIAEELLNMPQEERKKFRQTYGYHIIRETGDFESFKIKKDSTLQ